MVSDRQGASADDQVHLGLGLYVARLICEYHGGTISVVNSVVNSVTNGSALGELVEVRFSVLLPLQHPKASSQHPTMRQHLGAAQPTITNSHQLLPKRFPMPQLLKMLEMQDAMNTKVNNAWRAQGFAWYRAIWVECAELMDHYGWKWWKKQQPDMEQVILELVDIWHFGLSDLLQHESHGGQLAEQLAQELTKTLSNIGLFREELEHFVEAVLTRRSFDVHALPVNGRG